MISPYKIGWNGYLSTVLPFNITTCLSFDGDSGDIETHLGREAVVSETYNGALKRGGSYKWSESMSPSITIMKEDFSDFTREENRRILSWLTGRQTPGFLDVYMDSDIASNNMEYSILGNFISVSQYKLGNSRVVGYVAQFESLMPWALSPLITKEKDVSSPEGNTFTITINTDEPEAAVYPRITIKHNDTNYVRIADGTVLNIHSEMIDNTDYFNGTTHYWKTAGSTKVNSTIKPDYDWIVKEVDHAYGDSDAWESGYIYKYGENYYWLDPHTFHSSTKNPNLQTTSVKITNTYVDDNGMTHIAKCRVANNILGETIVLDGANKVVSSSRISRVFGDDFMDWEWIPLYDGENQIKIEGNCSVVIEYREVRKVGEL